MGILSKPLWVILGVLGIALAGSLAWGFRSAGQASTLRAELNSVQRDLVASNAALTALQKQVRQSKAVDAAQSDTRAKAARTVRAVRAATTKERESAKESEPIGTATQLDRLRRLTDAANAGIRTASKLP